MENWSCEEPVEPVEFAICVSAYLCSNEASRRICPKLSMCALVSGSAFLPSGTIQAYHNAAGNAFELYRPA